MNANELTALISECLRETDDHEFFLKLESVLRQQQAEIEALKNILEQEGIGVGRDLLNSGIALFRRATKEVTHPANPYKAITNTKIEPTVVSYTNPIEPTDEEKLQFGMLFMNWNRSLKEPLVKPAYEQYVFEQAIAILRKAQEK